MTKRQPNTDSEATTGRVVNLKAMSQADAAWLLGRPTSFLKHHANLFDRDEQGRYDARQIVAAVIEKDGGKVKSAKLSEADTELLTQVAERISWDIAPLKATIDTIDRAVDQHGLAALATFGEIFLASIREYYEEYGDHPYHNYRNVPKGSRQELEAKAAEYVREWLQQQAAHSAKAAGRVVCVCQNCKRYRWAGKMLRQPIPDSYVADEFVCKGCKAKGAEYQY